MKREKERETQRERERERERERARRIVTFVTKIWHFRNVNGTHVTRMTLK